MSWEIDHKKYEEQLRHALMYTEAGKITKSLGLGFEAHLPGAALGSLCRIIISGDPKSSAGVDAEVVGFRDKRVFLMPFEDVPGVNNDSLVVLKKRSSTVAVSDNFLGRVIDGRGEPIDDLGSLYANAPRVEERNLYEAPTHPLQRERIEDQLELGIRSIDGLLSCGKGQRIGIMAGSGVGKSVLLGMIARHTQADVNVIALIGERGREVREFVENELGPEGLKKSVVVVSTSDRSPLLRMRGAYLATSVAEYFRDQGKDVLLLMDSVTRFCMAQREIGLSLGEPPTTKGYTPSVFSTIPKLLERAGMAPKEGSITGLYSVLVEGDDMDDPISDSARAVLDGHIVLSRRIAQMNHFPAVDVLQSTSRVMRAVVDKEHLKWADQVKDLMAIYNEAEDLINVGAYVKGANRAIDQAVSVHDRIQRFLRQQVDEGSTLEQTKAVLHSITRAAQAAVQEEQEKNRPQKTENPNLSRVQL